MSNKNNWHDRFLKSLAALDLLCKAQSKVLILHMALIASGEFNVAESNILSVFKTAVQKNSSIR